MNRLMLLLAGSVSLNIALIFLLAFTRASTPIRKPDPMPPPATPTAVHAERLHTSEPLGPPPAPAVTAQVREYRQLLDALRSAGVSETAIIRLVRGAAVADWLADVNRIRASEPSRPYWRASSLFGEDLDVYRRIVEARRLRETALAEVLGEPQNLNPMDETRQHLPAGISPGKARAVAWLEEDYHLLTSGIYSRLAESSLPEDREALRLLEEERRRDLAAVLTPEELEHYELRTSDVAALLRHELRYFSPSEEEFLALFRLRRQPEGGALERELERVFGEERYEEYQRATDHEYQQLKGLSERLGLREGDAEEIYAFHRLVERQTEEIANDPELTAAERAEAFELLFLESRTVLLDRLGAEGFDAYMERGGDWLRELELGSKAAGAIQ